MLAPTAARSSPASHNHIAAFGVLAVALIARILQLAAAMSSPLTYQAGADEDYYQRFGQAVASGQGELSPEFTFMDPAYGYLLGAVFRLCGVNLFVVYLLQVLLDTATAYGILTAGRLLGRPKAGLYGALLYALTSTAVMFCTTLLKEIWVSSFMTWWVVCALVLLQSPQRRSGWCLFGAFCAVGVALRSTLILMGLVAMLLPLLSTGSGAGRKRRIGQAALVAGGMILALLPWSWRNHVALGEWSAFPNNGGIVLHQIYNADNPTSDISVPSFVSYSHPSEIWRGYATEASRRLGRALSPSEVDRYWRGEALSFMQAHPGDVLRDVLRKARGWLSSTEVPSSRSDVEEKMFSPLLRMLPAPGVWLFALGLAGLVWLAREDRRWVLIATPIAVAWLGFVVFFAQSRFRFYATSTLALCAGIWIDQLARNYRTLLQWRTGAPVGLAVSIAVAAIVLGSRDPPLTVHWDRIAWGYINMGNLQEAASVAQRAARDEPANGAIIEALGYTAAARQHYGEAKEDFERAIELRPRSHLAHYNLARVYLALGDHTAAAAEAKIAAQLNPSPDYDALVVQLAAAN